MMVWRAAKKIIAKLKIIATITVVSLVLTSVAEARKRWTAAKASDWYDKQPWFVGSNYIHANAINQLEM